MDFGIPTFKGLEKNFKLYMTVSNKQCPEREIKPRTTLIDTQRESVYDFDTYELNNSKELENQNLKLTFKRKRNKLSNMSNSMEIDNTCGTGKDSPSTVCLQSKPIIGSTADNIIGNVDRNRSPNVSKRVRLKHGSGQFRHKKERLKPKSTDVSVKMIKGNSSQKSRGRPKKYENEQFIRNTLCVSENVQNPVTFQLQKTTKTNGANVLNVSRTSGSDNCNMCGTTEAVISNILKPNTRDRNSFDYFRVNLKHLSLMDSKITEDMTLYKFNPTVFPKYLRVNVGTREHETTTENKKVTTFDIVKLKNKFKNIKVNNDTFKIKDKTGTSVKCLNQSNAEVSHSTESLFSSNEIEKTTCSLKFQEEIETDSVISVEAKDANKNHEHMKESQTLTQTSENADIQLSEFVSGNNLRSKNEISQVDVQTAHKNEFSRMSLQSSNQVKTVIIDLKTNDNVENISNSNLSSLDSSKKVVTTIQSNQEKDSYVTCEFPNRLIAIPKTVNDNISMNTINDSDISRHALNTSSLVNVSSCQAEECLVAQPLENAFATKQLQIVPPSNSIFDNRINAYNTPPPSPPNLSPQINTNSKSINVLVSGQVVLEDKMPLLELNEGENSAMTIPYTCESYSLDKALTESSIATVITQTGNSENNQLDKMCNKCESSGVCNDNIIKCPKTITTLKNICEKAISSFPSRTVAKVVDEESMCGHIPEECCVTLISHNNGVDSIESVDAPIDVSYKEQDGLSQTEMLMDMETGVVDNVMDDICYETIDTLIATSEVYVATSETQPDSEQLTDISESLNADDDISCPNAESACMSLCSEDLVSFDNVLTQKDVIKTTKSEKTVQISEIGLYTQPRSVQVECIKDGVNPLRNIKNHPNKILNPNVDESTSYDSDATIKYSSDESDTGETSDAVNGGATKKQKSSFKRVYLKTIKTKRKTCTAGKLVACPPSNSEKTEVFLKPSLPTKSKRTLKRSFKLRDPDNIELTTIKRQTFNANFQKTKTKGNKIVRRNQQKSDKLGIDHPFESQLAKLDNVTCNRKKHRPLRPITKSKLPVNPKLISQLRKRRRRHKQVLPGIFYCYL